MELASREVHTGPQLAAMRDGELPLTDLAACLVEDPTTDGVDEPCLLGQRNEYGGRNLTANRMVPPQQRLNAANNGRVGIHDRLKVHGEFIAEEGHLEIVLEIQAVQDLGVLALLEELVAPFPLVLRQVHRHVRTTQ